MSNLRDRDNTVWLLVFRQRFSLTCFLYHQGTSVSRADRYICAWPPIGSINETMTSPSKTHCHFNSIHWTWANRDPKFRRERVVKGVDAWSGDPLSDLTDQDGFVHPAHCKIWKSEGPVFWAIEKNVLITSKIISLRPVTYLVADPITS